MKQPYIEHEVLLNHLSFKTTVNIILKIKRINAWRQSQFPQILCIADRTFTRIILLLISFFIETLGERSSKNNFTTDNLTCLHFSINQFHYLHSVWYHLNSKVCLRPEVSLMELCNQAHPTQTHTAFYPLTALMEAFTQSHSHQQLWGYK